MADGMVEELAQPVAAMVLLLDVRLVSVRPVAMLQALCSVVPTLARRRAAVSWGMRKVLLLISGNWARSRSGVRQPDQASCFLPAMFSAIELFWPSPGMMTHATR
jgi:hypothetical protein